MGQFDLNLLKLIIQQNNTTSTHEGFFNQVYILSQTGPIGWVWFLLPVDDDG